MGDIKGNGSHRRSITDGCHLAGGSSTLYSIPRINDFNDANSAATVRVETR